MKLEKHLNCDVLVVGAGLAGLRAAYDCAKRGKNVILAVRAKLCSGASFYPLTAALGCQMPDSDEDREVYVSELLETGLGIADEELCRTMVYEIRGEAARLGELGIETEPCGGRPACFAKRERILRKWGGWETIRENCRKIFAELPNVTVMEYCDLLRLIRQEDTVCGGILCDHDGHLIRADAGAVILATGGYCGLYQHALNTEDVSGSGHSIAMDAGAELINMEFMQFIPGLISPIYKLLFHEATLWHCYDVRDEWGSSILPACLPEGISVEDCLLDRAKHGPFSTNDRSRYFEQAMMECVNRTGTEKGFTILYRDSLNTDPNPYLEMSRQVFRARGIDLVKDPISILPFAHCANGGVRMDKNAASTVPGLFVAGETAGGLHGADRHGGAATAACLVFGARAAASACAFAETSAVRSACTDEELIQALEQWMDTGVSSAITPTDVLQELRRRLWCTAGVIRVGKDLEELLSWITRMRREYNAAAAMRSGWEIKRCMMAFHALRTAEALVRAILLRQESRGPHYRVDFPERDVSLQGKRITVRETDGICAQYLPAKAE